MSIIIVCRHGEDKLKEETNNDEGCMDMLIRISVR